MEPASQAGFVVLGRVPVSRVDEGLLPSPRHGYPATMTPEERKHAAMAFYDLMFNECRPREAVERYVGDDYVQHNPGVRDGKDGFIAYFERAAARWPGK